MKMPASFANTYRASPDEATGETRTLGKRLP